MAQAFALKEWIAVGRMQGRVALYEITGAGRSMVRRVLAAEGVAPPAEIAPQIGAGDADAPQAAGAAGRSRRPRCASTESPLATLARRRDHDGRPFLAAELVAAGERLREDFELAQMGPRLAQNWDRFLTAGCGQGIGAPETGGAGGPARARDRVAAALRDLGPGLGDMVLRCCCFLEGLETAERRMGWSARSGKIVLRIALIRLSRHYDETYGRGRPLIG